jgi:hypothetical protein
MSLVRVYNRNVYPYKENFKGEWITIQPNEFVTMDDKKAQMFMGTYAPAKKTPMGEDDPIYFKKLEVVEVDNAPAKEETRFICNADGTEHATKEALEKWEAEHHLDKLTDVKVADEIRKKAKK